MKLTIGKRLILGFATIVLVFAILQTCIFYYMRTIGNVSQITTDNAVPALDLAHSVELALWMNHARLISYIHSTDRKEMDAITAQMDQTVAQASQNRKTYGEVCSPDEKSIMESANEVRSKYQKLRKQCMELNYAGRHEEALAMLKTSLEPAFAEYSKTITPLVDANRKRAENAGNDIHQALGTTKRIVIWGFVGTLAISVTLSVMISKSITRPVAMAAKLLSTQATETSSAAAQVASASQSLAQRVTQQASALESTCQSLSQMATQTASNNATARKAEQTSQSAHSSADAGNVVMTEMSAAITDIEKSAAETARILKVIDEIAFQTNLLALNAAVEAARAGEAGKGFAVVAEEVRSLAQRSAEASRNTAELIEKSVERARNGVELVGKVREQLESITTAATEVDTLIGTIAESSTEQSAGIDQINTTMRDMEKTTQENAASAEESAAASEELSGQAAQLTGVVEQLKQLVG